MKIGLIAPPWVPVPPPAYGGTESVVDRLARGLTSAGHEVLLAAASNSTCPVEQVLGSPAAAAGAPATGDSTDEMGYLLNAYSTMFDCDLIHDHTLVGPIMQQWHPRQVISTFHHPFDIRFASLYRQHKGATIAISHNQAGRASAEHIRVDAVIHHGIDVEDIPVGRGDGGYVSFLGRMSPAKGVREAIMIARSAGVPLKIAAKLREQSEKVYFDTMVKPLLSSTIEYLGELDADEKYALLGGSFAMLNPIQWDEPFGLTMIEALACGTPVVSVPRGAVPEIIEEGVTGFLRWGAGRMASALVNTKELDRALCRKSAREQFDSSYMVEKHIQFYKGLMEEER